MYTAKCWKFNIINHFFKQIQVIGSFTMASGCQARLEKSISNTIFIGKYDGLSIYKKSLPNNNQGDNYF